MSLLLLHRHLRVLGTNPNPRRAYLPTFRLCSLLVSSKEPLEVPTRLLDVRKGGLARWPRASFPPAAHAVAALRRPICAVFPHSHSSVRTYSIATREVRIESIPVADDSPVNLKQIMETLRDLELLETLRGTKPASGNNYKDAQRALYPLYHTIDSPSSSSDLVTFFQLKSALPSIYTLAWGAISQLLLNGKVDKLASLDKEEKAAVLFRQVYGVGPKFATRFAAEGARSLKGLGSKCKLTKAQAIGLRHVEDINRLIPRIEMEELKTTLEKVIEKVDQKLECAILGSFRRGVSFSSDIDLVVRHPSFQTMDDEEVSKTLLGRMLAELEAANLIEKENQLMFGPKKYSGLIKLPNKPHCRRIDIRMAPEASFHYMLLGSSGDALLLKLLRHVAKQKGLCLNEYGMGDKFDTVDENPNGFRPGTMRVVNSEEDIFKLLGFPYLEPEQRDYAVWRKIYNEAGVNVDALVKR